VPLLYVQPQILQARICDSVVLITGLSNYELHFPGTRIMFLRLTAFVITLSSALEGKLSPDFFGDLVICHLICCFQG
jgi:hypothetical protein